MENASKALLIAGSILIAILIVSLGVLIFNQFGDAAKNAADMSQQEISEFNSKLTPYLGKSILSSQVNALLQYSLSNNMSAKKNGEKNKAITITIEKQDGSTETLNADSEGFTRVDTGYYTVEGTYDTDGLLTKINITKNVT